MTMVVNSQREAALGRAVVAESDVRTSGLVDDECSRCGPAHLPGCHQVQIKSFAPTMQQKEVLHSKDKCAEIPLREITEANKRCSKIQKPKTPSSPCDCKVPGAMQKLMQLNAKS